MIKTLFLMFGLVSVMITVFTDLSAQTAISPHSLTFAPNDESFFPLVPGSFWRTQDSSFTFEGGQILTEDLGIDPKTVFLDSVISLKKIPNGWAAEVLSFTGNKKKPTKIRYFVDSLGFVFKGLYTKVGLEMRDFSIARTTPTNKDTIFEDGWNKDRPLAYAVCKTTATLSSLVSESDPTAINFVQGIGQVRRAYGYSFARNLIEYRIGNGPIVKKRWIMKKPEEK